LCEDGKGGNINIFDPRINIGRGYGNRFKNLFGNKLFSPKTGDVLVLPSFVYHCNDYFNGSARLVLTVDFMHKDLFLNGGIDY